MDLTLAVRTRRFCCEKSYPMPASITLSGLFWSTPDESPVFIDLNLNFCSGARAL